MADIFFWLDARPPVWLGHQPGRMNIESSPTFRAKIGAILEFTEFLTISRCLCPFWTILNAEMDSS